MTVYNMPITLRKFVFKKIEETLKKEQEQVEKAKGKQTLKKPKIKTPHYKTKARK